MQKPKIVLFVPAPAKNYYWTRVPLPLIAVSSLMHEAGIRIVIITAKEPNWKEQILKEAKGCLFIGISAMTGYQIHEGLLAAGIVRKADSKIPIVFGGWHPTIMPKQTCAHPLVDIVVKRQGERTLSELADCLINNKDLNSIKGIVYKEGGQIIETEERMPEDINNFPAYPYGLLDCSGYLYKTDYGARTINYVSSRGCPHRCSFCAEALVNKRRWFALPADRVVSEVQKIVEGYDVDALTIDDSNFFVDKQRVIDICEGLLKKNIKIRWGDVNAHAKDMLKYEDEVWELMKKSGLHGLLIGAESGLDEALRLLNKDAVVEDTVRLREKTGKFNIKLHLSLMVGLPQTDTYKCTVDDEIKSIQKLISRCYKINRNLSSQVFFYTPYPGSLLYKESLKHGINEPASLEGWIDFSLNSSHLSNIKKKHERIVNCINSSMGYLYAKFTRTKQFEGYKVVKGRNMLRKMVWRLIDTLGYFSALCRWKYNIFKFPIENHIVNYAIYLKNIGKFRN